MGRKTVYNQIVNEDEYEKVNPDNKLLLEDFMSYMSSIGRAEGTINNYNSDIKICFIWILNNAKNKEFVDLTKREIVRYQNWLMNELELSSSRVRRLRSSISSMSNFIETILDEDYPEFRNIINTIEAPPKKPVRKKSVFEDEEIEELLDILVKEGKVQEACCLALAVSSGARKSELTRFKVDYFNPENKILGGSLYRTPEPILTKGKGGKMLHKFTLANIFDEYLDLWLKERKLLGVDNEYLFVRKDNDEYLQVLPSTLDSWAETFNRYIDKHFYWHSCRHYFTTHLSKNNLPAEVIMEIVGWESVDMVSLYNDMDILSTLGMYFGEDGIKQVEQGDITDL